MSATTATPPCSRLRNSVSSEADAETERCGSHARRFASRRSPVRSRLAPLEKCLQESHFPGRPGTNGGREIKLGLTVGPHFPSSAGDLPRRTPPVVRTQHGPRLMVALSLTRSSERPSSRRSPSRPRNREHRSDWAIALLSKDSSVFAGISGERDHRAGGRGVCSDGIGVTAGGGALLGACLCTYEATKCARECRKFVIAKVVPHLRSYTKCWPRRA
jgi:hypothetical protein